MSRSNYPRKSITSVRSVFFFIEPKTGLLFLRTILFMIHIGLWNELRVVKSVDFGLYLDGGEAGEILLPKRFVPVGVKEGYVLKVFLYHDSEGRIIATTQEPLGAVGDIIYLKVVDTNRQ